MAHYTAPFSIVTWALAILANPVIFLIALNPDVKAFEGLMLVAITTFASCAAVVYTSLLFQRPTFRLADLLSLVAFYALLSSLLIAAAPGDLSVLRKLRLLLPALLLTVWGAAWAWHYLELFDAQSTLRRLGVYAAGWLFLLCAPLALWGLLMLIALFLFDVDDAPPGMLAIWFVALVGLLPGIFIERRARNLRALKWHGTP